MSKSEVTRKIIAGLILVVGWMVIGVDGLLGLTEFGHFGHPVIYGGLGICGFAFARYEGSLFRSRRR